jgi:pilus assembly protein CpaF
MDMSQKTATGEDVAFADIRAELLSRIEPSTVAHLPEEELVRRIERLLSAIANEQQLALNRQDQALMTQAVVDDITGLGPLEFLLRDNSINDIMVNGPDEVYVERLGILERTNIRFRDKQHTLFVAQRIASTIGRRIDESNPMLDARLLDGSRVNIILPPLAVNGPYFSIRKFYRDVAELPVLVRNGAMSPNMAKLLNIAAKCRLNIIISGGTGAGKTTLLNAMSQSIGDGERVVTIEDVAELQLKKSHVLPLETRQANIEGRGEIGARDLVKNALRMRPDRIIIGEVRGAEAFDMMQAMNTGHNGSMTTIHANTTEDAIRRIENMVQMAETALPVSAIRSQINSAVDMIVQVERMRDGIRRITNIAYLKGIENGEIIVESLSKFKYLGEKDGKIISQFVSNTSSPPFFDRLSFFGEGEAFLEALSADSEGLDA